MYYKCPGGYSVIVMTADNSKFIEGTVHNNLVLLVPDIAMATTVLLTVYMSAYASHMSVHVST